MRGGDSFEFHRSDCVRVSGYLVAGIFGHDTTASVYDDRGAKRPDCARVKKGGTMYVMWVCVWVCLCVCGSVCLYLYLCLYDLCLCLCLYSA